MSGTGLVTSMTATPLVGRAVQVAFVAYAVIGFAWAAVFLWKEKKAGRLLGGPSSPSVFPVAGGPGWTFALGVIVLLFLQSPLYLVLVLVGLGMFLTNSRQTVSGQFGFDRLGLGEVLGLSLLICGAVAFVEVPLSAAVDWGMNAVHFPHPEQESVEVFRSLRQPALIFWFIVQAVILSPLMEELFFRGFLFTFLKKYTATIPALILSAGVFAFAHANLGAVVQLWFLGLVLGLAYERTGSLPLAVGIHGGWNLLTAISLLIERGHA